MIERHNKFHMGRAPYKFLGAWSMPSLSLQEANPQAYNNIMLHKPSCCVGCCDHCGMGIMHHMIIRDADGKRFAIGTTCIEKLHDTKLVTAAHAAMLDREKAKRAAHRIAKQELDRLRREAELQGQRDSRESGRTNAEHEKWIAAEALKSIKAYNFDIAELFILTLLDARSEFAGDVAERIMEGRTLSPNAERIMLEIVAKKAGRKNSKKYIAEHDRIQPLWLEARSKLQN